MNLVFHYLKLCICHRVSLVILVLPGPLYCFCFWTTSTMTRATQLGRRNTRLEVFLCLLYTYPRPLHLQARIKLGGENTTTLL